MKSLETIGKEAKAAARFLRVTETNEKNEALLCIADALCAHKTEILAANAKDLEAARANHTPAAMLDRLALSESRIDDMANGVREIAALPDPVGHVLEDIERPNGLHIQKVSVPLGVLAVIFEARPNVTSDAAALALKAGNAVILRGGKEAIHSNTAIAHCMQEALRGTALLPESIGFLEDTSRESANALMRLNQYVDVLIPRGGRSLIRATVENSTVPVIETGVGNCHIYVDQDADLAMARDIVYNAKTSRVSVCNAAESLVLHKDIATEFLPMLYAALSEKQVVLYGDERAKAILPQIESATETDYRTEYLDYKLSIKVVDSLEEALLHIETYSTGHSECIVTQNEQTAKRFLQSVDSAAVYHNASTRFTDGGCFGFGAEIGISTQKLHARGPLGLPQLTSFKYQITGNGQRRE